jgi:hypothetical protein
MLQPAREWGLTAAMELGISLAMELRRDRRKRTGVRQSLVVLEMWSVSRCGTGV